MAVYLVLEGEGKDTDQYLREPFEYNNKGKYKYKTFDNDNKAEIQWWTHLVEELFNNTVIIKPTNGNGNFDDILRILVKRKTTEKIIFCPDWHTTDTTKIKIMELNKKYTRICESHTPKIQFETVFGYTFEWAILSFPYLLEWIYCSKMRDNTKSRVYKMCRRHTAFCKLNDPSIWSKDKAVMQAIEDSSVPSKLKNVIKAGKVDSVTFEQICYEILGDLTHSSGLQINSKGELGECWSCSCDGNCRQLRRYGFINKIPIAIRCNLVYNKNRKVPFEKYLDILKHSTGLKYFPKDLI